MSPVDPLYPWSAVVTALGWLSVCIGLVTLSAASLRWMLARHLVAGALIGVGALATALVVGAAPLLAGAIEGAVYTLLAPRSGWWVSFVSPFSVGWGAVMIVVGAGQAMVGTAALLVRLEAPVTEDHG